MNSGVDDQTYGTEEFRGQSTVVRDWVLVEADLFAELLRVQCPAFAVGSETETVKPELGQSVELLLHGQLHVMSGNALVVSDRLVVDERASGEVGSGDHHASGALAIGCAGDVMGCGGGLEGGYRFNGDWRLGKQGE